MYVWGGATMSYPIVCAALRLGDWLIVGPRHFDMVMKKQLKLIPLSKPNKENWEEGFIDTQGKFYSRFAAYRIADEHGQIDQDRNDSTRVLFSEGLY